MQEKLLDAESLMFLKQMRLKLIYREYTAALTDEIQKEWLPKLQAIHTRLNSGSDAMRDEGHKVWLICNAITSALNSVDYLMKDEPNL
jgi:hypothetical protein